MREKKKLGLAVNCISVKSTSIFGFNLPATKGFLPIASFLEASSRCLCSITELLTCVYIKPSYMKKEMEISSHTTTEYNFGLFQK